MIRMTAAAITALLSVSAAQAQRRTKSEQGGGKNLYSKATHGAGRGKAREYRRGHAAHRLHQRFEG
jgi:hypothetical protein